VVIYLPDILLLLSAWAKSKACDAVDRVLSILHTIEQQELQPDVQTYSSVIDCIARRGKNPEQAEALVDRMMKAGVCPNVVIYSALINGAFGCSSMMLGVNSVPVFLTLFSFFQPGRNQMYPMQWIAPFLY
jgi:pentatricopeptide repeat protein